VKVEIWSDVVCPWCYVGKRRFETALERFAHRADVEVEWKSFELDPSADSQRDGDYAGALAEKYGTTRERAQEMLDSMTATAAAEGLDFHFERAVHANTFDAHQLIHLAAERGRQDAVKERLLRAYFTEGAAVGDRDVLVELVVEAGLDAAEARAALADQRFASDVRADEATARQLGATGVPFFVIDRKYGVSGAQPAEHLLAVLEQAWAESRPLTMVAAGGDAEACGPDGCAV
jgi:predicted DsbA family dithiol-disulfide isomerase